MSPANRQRLVGFAFGGVLVIGGLGFIAKPLLDTYTRGHADNRALSTWQKGGSGTLTGAVPQPGAAPPPRTAACGAGSASDTYALVSFSSMPQYGYAGVAIDGDWNGLLQRSMVHWHGSPAPGQQGNVIIAFHREPDYEHIDQLDVGQSLTVQDRACHSFTYKVTQRSTLDPSRVTQLVPTTGHDLTLITCTPFWQDYNRIVWRATLVAKDGQPVTSA